MRTEKPGRNDPCVCGSGKKYKFCCMDKGRAAPVSNASLEEMTEEWALRRLLAASKPFQAFYNRERAAIGEPLVWTARLLMPTGINVQAIRLPGTGKPAMYLRQAPAAPTDALAVAHELAHLLLDAEGFPLVVATSDQQPAASLLNSLVQDPLIDLRLQKYGFDVVAKMQRDLATALGQLRQAQPPLDRATRTMWVLNYAGQLLEWRIVAPEREAAQTRAFLQWFRSHQPAIAGEGDELVGAAERMGFDTPERMRSFFAWAIHQRQLEDTLVIQSKGQ